MKILNLTSGEYSDFGNVALLCWEGEGDGGLGTIEVTFREFQRMWKEMGHEQRRAIFGRSWNSIEAFMDHVLLPMGWKKLEHETLHGDD